MATNETTRILKAHAARNLGGKIAFNYEDLRKRCDDHLEQVRLDTREMILEAQSEADEIRKQAHKIAAEAGHREGMKRAEAEIQKRGSELADKLALEKLKTTLPAMKAIAEALELERDRWLRDWEETAVRLSISVARRIIRQYFDAHPEAAGNSFKEALELTTGNSQISVRVHPNDGEVLGNCLEEVRSSMAACGEVTIVRDEKVEPGGCLIETEHGVIDARIETQLERITEELLEHQS